MAILSLKASLMFFSLLLLPKAGFSVPDSVPDGDVPQGFLLPIGGGASSGDTGGLKPAQISIHRAALRQLEQNLGAGSQVGPLVCILEYRPEDAGSAEGIAVNRSLFLAAGAADERIKAFYFNSREKADDPKTATQDLKDCGLFYIPGGNQSTIYEMWVGTWLHRSLLAVLSRGGGIMGKSAGAALQGSVMFLPQDDSETSTAAMLESVEILSDELRTSFLADRLALFPKLYIETHTGDRERNARALAIMAAWEARQPKAAAKTSGMALDSDTAVLMTFDPKLKAWTGEVLGARAVEFFFPSSDSRSSITASGQPVYTNVISHLLLAGTKLQLSGQGAGRILARELDDGSRARAFARSGLKQHCLDRIPLLIRGESTSEGEESSSVYFLARQKSGEIQSIDTVEYAYLNGDMLAYPGGGCGYWSTHAFDRNFGRPENRLHAQRFAVGAQLADFSIALPRTMQARILKPSSAKREIRFEAVSDEGSSVFILDGRRARNRGIGRYIYHEYGASGPVQTGSWESARAHLLPPLGIFDYESAAARVR